MKKFVFILVLLFITASLASCGGRKKGCGLTGVNKTETVVSTQNIEKIDVAVVE